ncbi:MAG TPA: PD-(D/E)XK nuclease family protein, partial [Spirochaetota bacterium]|nr:PD-(D/E)XK nuclease family protein [Spirochaetota bacterium]
MKPEKDLNMKEVLDETLNDQNFNDFIVTLTSARLEIEKSYTYNILKTLKLETDETKLHSSFIADLLNPNGFHKQGVEFLNLFINDICKMKVSATEKNTHVKVEHTIKDKLYIDKKNPENSKGGRIDILINDGPVSSFIIAIENKIYAEDQLHQIIRYHNFLKEEKYSEKRLIYLTLFGDNPSELSIGKCDPSFFKDTNLMNISYESHIIPWLNKCQESCENNTNDAISSEQVTRLKLAIIQYREIIERLLGSSIIKVVRGDKMNETLLKTENLRTLKILNQKFEAITMEIIYKIVQKIIKK